MWKDGQRENGKSACEVGAGAESKMCRDSCSQGLDGTMACDMHNIWGLGENYFIEGKFTTEVSIVNHELPALKIRRYNRGLLHRFMHSWHADAHDEAYDGRLCLRDECNVSPLCAHARMRVSGTHYICATCPLHSSCLSPSPPAAPLPPPFPRVPLSPSPAHLHSRPHQILPQKTAIIPVPAPSSLILFLPLHQPRPLIRFLPLQPRRLPASPSAPKASPRRPPRCHHARARFPLHDRHRKLPCAPYLTCESMPLGASVRREELCFACKNDRGVSTTKSEA